MKAVPPQAASAGDTSPVVLRKPLWLVSLAFAFLSFGLPIYSKGLGASALVIGGLYSIFTLTILVLRPLVGSALDRFGRKIFFVVGLLTYSLAYLAFALTGGLAGLYLARFLQGLASALLWISLYTIVTDLSASNERGQQLGRIQEISARGQVIGVFLGLGLMGYFQEQRGWQLAFEGYALLAVAGAFLAWRRVPETLPTRQRPVSTEGIPSQLKRLMVIVFTTGASAAMISPLYMIFVQDRFTSNIFALAWAFFPAGVVYSLLPSRLGRLSDRYGRAPMMAAGLIGTGALSFFLPHVRSLVALAGLYTLSSVGWSLADPAEVALVADLTGSDRRGRGYGLYEFAGSLGATIGPLVGGWLYEAVSQPAPFYLNGAILFASAGWVLFALHSRTAATIAPTDD